MRTGDAEALNAALLRQGVVVRPLGAFGAPDALRITAGTPDEIAFLAREASLGEPRGLPRRGGEASVPPAARPSTRGEERGSGLGQVGEDPVGGQRVEVLGERVEHTRAATRGVRPLRRGLDDAV